MDGQRASRCSTFSHFLVSGWASDNIDESWSKNSSFYIMFVAHQKYVKWLSNCMCVLCVCGGGVFYHFTNLKALIFV